MPTPIKTKANVISSMGAPWARTASPSVPEEIMKNYGADILRLWVASVDYSEDIRLSDEIISHIVDSYRRIRNTFKYMLGNLDGFNVSKKVLYEEMPEIDRYIMHELSKTITAAVTHYNNYEFHRVYRILHDFCAVQLSSFYFDCVKDRLYTFQRDSLLRRSAQTVLYELTFNLVKLMSPIISHTAEEAWCLFGCKNSNVQSVFLTAMPEANETQLNNELAVKWEKVLAIRAKVTKALELAREKDLIGNSLQAQVLLFIKAKDMDSLIRDIDINWNEVFIVSAVKICDDYEEIKKSAVNSHSEELSIGINKAPGKKCVRCWNYSLSTGNDAEHPEICGRCLEVIKAISLPSDNS